MYVYIYIYIYIERERDMMLLFLELIIYSGRGQLSRIQSAACRSEGARAREELHHLDLGMPFDKSKNSQDLAPQFQIQLVSCFSSLELARGRMCLTVPASVEGGAAVCNLSAHALSLSAMDPSEMERDETRRDPHCARFCSVCVCVLLVPNSKVVHVFRARGLKQRYRRPPPKNSGLKQRQGKRQRAP